MKLRQVIEQYITLKQSLGFRFRTERRILQGFGQAMGKITLGQVRPVAVRTYLDGRGPVTTYWTRKWGALRGLYRFALARGLARRCPLPLSAPKVAVPFTPYIYSQPELRRLLQAVTPERTKGLSPQTMRTLLLLLYGAGLRLSEALKLEQDDVDIPERLLQVRQSKFFKSRLVPRSDPSWPRCWQIIRQSALRAMAPADAFCAPIKARPLAVPPPSASSGSCVWPQRSNGPRDAAISPGCTICVTPWPLTVWSTGIATAPTCRRCWSTSPSIWGTSVSPARRSI